MTQFGWPIGELQALCASLAFVIIYMNSVVSEKATHIKDLSNRAEL